ncbi:MAG TPA: hypothetical protein VLB50_03910, partial [Ignavibacteriaceae bacterium]|nr:hypothetical protein [Ignavibacteriaceae bacterium]
MKTSGILLALAITAFTLNLHAQNNSHSILNTYKETAKNITESALVNRYGYSLLDELCRIGPRLSGSENSVKAIHWAENKMKESGFNNVWLQPVMVPHWVRGEVEEAVIENTIYEGRKINICALGGSIGTDDNGITAPVIEVKNMNEIDLLKDKVKG